MANELMFMEIAEMQAKENNVLIYNLQEPANLIVEAIDQKALDVNHLKEVFRVLEVDADLNNDLKFSARIGPFDPEADLENSPRPLIIGFKEKLMKENILRAAKNLKNSEFHHISIAADLTARQRRNEADLIKECKERNDNLTDEEASSFLWKLIGQRGNRQLRKVKVMSQDHSNSNNVPLGQRGRGGLHWEFIKEKKKVRKQDHTHSFKKKRTC